MYDEYKGDVLRKAAYLRRSNDAFRTSFTGGRIFVSKGFKDLPEELQEEAKKGVRTYNQFLDDELDEHDRGLVNIKGHKFFFRITYKDKSDHECREDSLNPCDPLITTKKLTICRLYEA